MSPSHRPPHVPPNSAPAGEASGYRWLRRILLAKAIAGVAVAGGLGAGYWLRAHGLTVGELASELRQRDIPRYDWHSIDKKHWQAASGTPGEPPELTDDREGTSAGCPSGMVRVKGAFRRELHGAATGEVERLQDVACTDWISRDFPARCRSFDREKIASEVAKLPTQQMDYCIDRFEYPNVFGVNPMIVATFREAEAICKKGSKRLCTESEWTFACEGEEVRPYPYGWTRDTTACVIDRSWRPFAEGALQPRDGDNARQELDRLWQGEPSGSRSGCKSPFGVYDMTGNVDEWTRSVNSTGFASVLKGGYWGPVRARCRPATRAHNEDFVAYQQSFRCCGDSNAEIPAPLPVPPVVIRMNDAGAATAAIAADAGSRASADLEAEWTADGRDEVEAITAARVALCSASPAANTRSGPSGVLAAFTVAAVLASSRRRRR
ncbi:MAG TPA: SUMF1/EgtB/PvdO family nonheme iron enzyme [Labilithrix sp.]|nr:SUMF1/EgtB/PvdO family nonheme iron enzyme [Labilithrix sp.]